MRNLPQDLRTFLLSKPAITNLVNNRIYVRSVPPDPSSTHIWLIRAGSENLECLDDSPGQEPFKQFIDLECISQSATTAEQLSDAIQDLFPMSGTLGSASVQRAYCNSQDDSYESRNTARSEFTQVAALSLEIYP
jgi:hypothetical protein